MKRNKTMRTILLDYVAANGPQTWSELDRVVLTVAGHNLNEKHWGIGYLDNVSPGSVCFPTRNESRYLRQVGGKYYLMNAR